MGFQLSDSDRIKLGAYVISFLEHDNGEAAWVDIVSDPNDDAWFIEIPALFEYDKGYNAYDTLMGTVRVRTRRRARLLASNLYHMGLIAHIQPGFNHRHN